MSKRSDGAKKAWKTNTLRQTLMLLIDEHGEKEFDKSSSLAKKRLYKLKNSR